MSLRKSLKKIGRKTAAVHTKINRVATPIAAAAAGFVAGAPGAAVVTAIGAQSGYYFRATQARNEGKMGSAARTLGRGERKRVAIYGAVGGGAGMLGSGAANLIAGKSFSSALGTTVFGQQGANLLGIDSIFSKSPVTANSQFVTAGNLAAQKGVPVPGLVTQSQLAPSLAGGSSELAGAGTSGASLGAKALGTIPALLDAYGRVKPASSGANGTINPNQFGPDMSSMFGGGGGGGESGGGGGGFMNSPTAEGESKGGLIAALVVGALLLAG